MMQSTAILSLVFASVAAARNVNFVLHPVQGPTVNIAVPVEGVVLTSTYQLYRYTLYAIPNGLPNPLQRLVTPSLRALMLSTWTLCTLNAPSKAAAVPLHPTTMTRAVPTLNLRLLHLLKIFTATPYAF